MSEWDENIKTNESENQNRWRLNIRENGKRTVVPCRVNFEEIWSTMAWIAKSIINIFIWKQIGNNEQSDTYKEVEWCKIILRVAVSLKKNISNRIKIFKWQGNLNYWNTLLRIWEDKM